MPRFISEAITPAEGTVSTAIEGAPVLPNAFSWRDETLRVHSLLRTWRGTKVDRGDVYLKRHWFEFELPDSRRVVVYFDRQAKPGVARWWLYTIDG